MCVCTHVSDIGEKCTRPSEEVVIFKYSLFAFLLRNSFWWSTFMLLCSAEWRIDRSLCSAKLWISVFFLRTLGLFQRQQKMSGSSLVYN
jgi:hypothetical protein